MYYIVCQTAKISNRYIYIPRVEEKRPLFTHAREFVFACILSVSRNCNPPYNLSGESRKLESRVRCALRVSTDIPQLRGPVTGRKRL